MKIKIKVKTNAKASEILGIKDDVYQVNVKSMPIDGKANKEIIKIFHKKFKKQVKIIKGLKGKEKVLEIG